jgi:hypothetical protein
MHPNWKARTVRNWRWWIALPALLLLLPVGAVSWLLWLLNADAWFERAVRPICDPVLDFVAKGY